MHERCAIARRMSNGVAGTGQLSDKNINLLQNYHGTAIRQNTDNMYQMKAIGATLFHCSAIKDAAAD